MTISLAFLAPNLVKAAVEGRLPRGIGIERLRDREGDVVSIDGAKVTVAFDKVGEKRVVDSFLEKARP
jgi:hypothetical protein